jgi:hypothetical protein
MKQLKAADAELSGRIKDLQKQKSDVYEKMKLLAAAEGEAATSLPPAYGGGDGYGDYVHLNYIRRTAYLRKHQNECGHVATSYGPHDGEDTERYERCSACLKTITQADRDQFIHY